MDSILSVEFLSFCFSFCRYLFYRFSCIDITPPCDLFNILHTIRTYSIYKPLISIQYPSSIALFLPPKASLFVQTPSVYVCSILHTLQIARLLLPLGSRFSPFERHGAKRHALNE